MNTMTNQPLSPAAQAVLDVVNSISSYGPDDCLNDARQIAVAALRAAAAIPSASAPVPFTYKLLAIANELEGAN